MTGERPGPLGVFVIRTRTARSAGKAASGEHVTFAGALDSIEAALAANAAEAALETVELPAEAAAPPTQGEQ